MNRIAYWIVVAAISTAGCSRHEPPTIGAREFFAKMVGVARAEEQWPQVGDEATGGKLILCDWLICPNGISRPDLGSVIETLPFTREFAPRVDFYAVFYILEDGNLKMWLYLPVIEGRLKSVIGLDGMELKFREIDKWIVSVRPGTL